MNGKRKCEILKDIRRQIAQKNDIDLQTEECTHKGDCLGTCPRCEAEVAYLEEELNKRRDAGLPIILQGCIPPEFLGRHYLNGSRSPYETLEKACDLSSLVKDVIFSGNTQILGGLEEAQPPKFFI